MSSISASPREKALQKQKADQSDNLTALGADATPYFLTLAAAASASAARGLLGVDAAGTDNSTAVTLANPARYLTLTGQELAAEFVDLATDVTGALPAAAVSGLSAVATSGAHSDLSGRPAEMLLVIGDEITSLAVSSPVFTFRMPFAMTLTGARASVSEAPVGAAIQLDIKEDGASILSAALSIDAAEKSSVTASAPAGIADGALADDAEITVDVAQVGSTTPGAGLKLWLIGTRA